MRDVQSHIIGRRSSCDMGYRLIRSCSTAGRIDAGNVLLRTLKPARRVDTPKFVRAALEIRDLVLR